MVRNYKKNCDVCSERIDKSDAGTRFGTLTIIGTAEDPRKRITLLLCDKCLFVTRAAHQKIRAEKAGIR